MMHPRELIKLDLLEKALLKRLTAGEVQQENACRLLNGFTEGVSGLVVEQYGKTLVFFFHHLQKQSAESFVEQATPVFLQNIPWLDCSIIKLRPSDDPHDRRGRIVRGETPQTQIAEHEVQYSIDLLMNQDSGFYLDMSNLRLWLRDQASKKDVLNLFAYTGSLGIAALAGGANKVFQVDRSSRFLRHARISAELNHSPGSMQILPLDFYEAVGRLKQGKQSFDLVILDPPYFSITQKGRVNLETEWLRLVNKVRPLVRDGGRLVVVNNALFLSGKEYMASLKALETSGYVSIEEVIPVPQSFIGYEPDTAGVYPADPLPFNHPTKIVVLRIKRKDQDN